MHIKYFLDNLLPQSRRTFIFITCLSFSWDDKPWELNSYIQKNQGQTFFIPSLTLSPSSLSMQCAAVRTQDGWMRTPPHRNLPLLFCSIIWRKKKRSLTLHGVWLTKYHTHCSLWLQNAQMHQAPKHVTFIEAKALQWDKSTTKKVSVKDLQKGFDPSSWIRAGFIQTGMRQSWSARKKHSGTSKLWNTAPMRVLFWCLQHTRDSVSSQAATLTLWCKRAFNIKENQALNIGIH